jgi:hypothetical protein
MSVTMTRTIFWDMTPQSLVAKFTDISEEHTVTVFMFVEYAEPANTWHHIPECSTIHCKSICQQPAFPRAVLS